VGHFLCLAHYSCIPLSSVLRRHKAVFTGGVHWRLRTRLDLSSGIPPSQGASLDINHSTSKLDKLWLCHNSYIKQGESEDNRSTDSEHHGRVGRPHQVSFSTLTESGLHFMNSIDCLHQWPTLQKVITLTLCRRFESDELITIKPENTDVTFAVQRAILVSASQYFAAALERDFAEAGTRILTLPGTDLETVRLFIYWITLRKLPNISGQSDALEQKSEAQYTFVTEQQMNLINLWVCSARLSFVHCARVSMF
jgi:hypothetical protein